MDVIEFSDVAAEIGADPAEEVVQATESGVNKASAGERKGRTAALKSLASSPSS
jgi:hypothetical protein